MNIEDVKQISIADYLHSLGYSPVKRQGNGLWYKSPLREEHEASFKVNTDRIGMILAQEKAATSSPWQRNFIFPTVFPTF